MKSLMNAISGLPNKNSEATTMTPKTMRIRTKKKMMPPVFDIRSSTFGAGQGDRFKVCALYL
jgi:hypothetical protein